MDEDEAAWKKTYRVVVLLNRFELESLIDMQLDSGLSLSSFVRQLIIRQHREEIGKKKNSR
jgi:hypothetical protein